MSVVGLHKRQQTNYKIRMFRNIAVRCGISSAVVVSNRVSYRKKVKKMLNLTQSICYARLYRRLLHVTYFVAVLLPGQNNKTKPPQT